MRRGTAFDPGYAILVAKQAGYMEVETFAKIVANKGSLTDDQINVLGDLIRTERVEVSGVVAPDALAMLG